MKNENYMSNNEFNEFLNYEIGGLTAHFTETQVTDRFYFEIQNGWLGIAKRLITDLVEMGWDKRVCQVKEKFGGLEFYVDRAPEGVLDRINEARKESHTVCEICGEPGELRTDRNWFKTLCDGCK